MAKAIVVIRSKVGYNEKDFLDELNKGVMRESGARLVSYTGGPGDFYKAVVEIDA